VRSVELLGHEEELKWEMTEGVLKIDRPTRRPCEHVYSFKITRHTSL